MIFDDLTTKYAGLNPHVEVLRGGRGHGQRGRGDPRHGGPGHRRCGRGRPAPRL